MSRGVIGFPKSVEVVRCKDCIWSKKPTPEQLEKYGLLDDALLCKFWKDKKGRWPFDYCSYGICRTELL